MTPMAAAAPAPPAAGGAAGDRESEIRHVEEQLGILIAQVHRAMRDRARAVHPELQSAALMVLLTIARFERTHAAELAEVLEMDKSMVSRNVAALTSLGLVSSEPDPHDGSARVLVATATARQRLAESRARVQEQMEGRLRTWEVGEVHELARLLQRLNDETVALLRSGAEAPTPAASAPPPGSAARAAE